MTLTSISLSECLPKIVELKKLKYFASPPNGEINASGTIRAVVELVERCQTSATRPGLPRRPSLGQGTPYTDCPGQTQADKPCHSVRSPLQRYMDVDCRKPQQDSRLCICDTFVTRECQCTKYQVFQAEFGTLL